MKQPDRSGGIGKRELDLFQQHVQNLAQIQSRSNGRVDLVKRSDPLETALGLAKEPGIFDCDTDNASDGLEELDLIRGKEFLLMIGNP